MTKQKLPDFITKPIKHESLDRHVGDVGTPELARRNQVEPYVVERSSTGQPTMIGARVVDQLPIDRYHARKQLDPDAERNEILYTAAKRLAQDFYYSGIPPRVTASYQPRTGGGYTGYSPTERNVCAFERYRDAMIDITPTLRTILRDVVCFGDSAKDWAIKHIQPKEAGITVLRLALTELAASYGLIKLDNTV